MSRWNAVRLMSAPFAIFAGVPALLLPAAAATAYPPPSGGGTGGGTIYYTYAGVLNTMNSDGSNKTPLPAGVSGEPSYAFHGTTNDRWFLHVADGELYAVRGDAAMDVQLTDSFDGITVVSDVVPNWAKDNLVTTTINEADSFVSFLGDAGGVEAIYRADTAFDSAGVPFLSSAAALVVADLDILQFDWSPSGAQLAYSRSESGNCGTVACPVINLHNVGGTTVFLTDGSQPAWSPSGAKIAFRTNGVVGDIATINSDGSGQTTILQGHAGRNISLYSPKWSPASTHLAYYRFGSFGSNIFDVYRATASGSSPTNLTADLANVAQPVAWR
ncbi:MAG TPA: hypothetical protein VGM03_06580 [Phycisphaerae bacterium]